MESLSEDGSTGSEQAESSGPGPGRAGPSDRLSESIHVLRNNLLIVQTEDDSVAFTDTTVMVVQALDGSVTVGGLLLHGPRFDGDNCLSDQDCMGRYGAAPYVRDRVQAGERCQVAVQQFSDSLAVLLADLDSTAMAAVASGRAIGDVTRDARDYLATHPFVADEDSSVSIVNIVERYGLLDIRLKGVRRRESWITPTVPSWRTAPVNRRLVMPGEHWHVEEWFPEKTAGLLRQLHATMEMPDGEHVAALAPWCCQFLKGPRARDVLEGKVRSDCPPPAARGRPGR